MTVKDLQKTTQLMNELSKMMQGKVRGIKVDNDEMEIIIPVDELKELAKELNQELIAKDVYTNLVRYSLCFDNVNVNALGLRVGYAENNAAESYS